VVRRDANQFGVSTGDGMDAGVEATHGAVARCAVDKPRNPPADFAGTMSLPGFGRHLVNGFCLSLRWRAVAIERVQALTIVKDLDVVKHLGLHLVMRLMATR
jgi:hypothetical protein